jgi:putative flippase GtrA
LKPLPRPFAFLFQFFKYGAAGAIGTAAHYVVLIFLVESLDMQTVHATSVGFIVGSVINYHLNRRYTFRQARVASFAYGRFLLIAIIGALINNLKVKWLLDNVAMHYLFAQLIATAVVLVWGFLANAMWTFRTVRDVKHD